MFSLLKWWILSLGIEKGMGARWPEIRMREADDRLSNFKHLFFAAFFIFSPTHPEVTPTVLSWFDKFPVIAAAKRIIASPLHNDIR